MSTARRLHYTYEEYLSVEEGSVLRHEYLDGEIYAMAGGTPAHGALGGRVGLLLARLLPHCTLLTSDVRIRVEATGLTTYPDVSFICGKAQVSPQDRTAVVNPVILVEVTSPSTQDYDRGDKLSHYRQIPSVQTILLVSHGSPRITVVTRDGAGWRTIDVRSGERVELTSPAAAFGVDEVYAVLESMPDPG